MLKSISGYVIVAFLLMTLTASPSNASPASCQSADAPCWRRLLENQLELDDSLQRELKLKTQLIDNQAQQIATLKTSNDQLGSALSDTRAVLPKVERSWHENPGLWLGGGIVLGILISLGAAAIVHATIH